MKTPINILWLFLVSSTLFSQSEADLKAQLEGKRVEILIEMPASSEGIDIYADKPVKLKYDEYSRRIKKYGTSLFPGDLVMITKIKKRGKHIEFQLAGGGYGTMGDESGHVSAEYIPKSSRQKEIEQILREDKDKKLPNRSKLENELNDLKRELKIAKNESRRQAALKSEMKKSRIQEQRLQGGSRFNIRYDYKIGRNELTFASIRQALRDYVSFSPVTGTSSTVSGTTGSTLTKGMTMEQAMTILGIPKDLNTESACGFEKTVCIFVKDGQKIEAIFIEKVLVKYLVSSL